MSWLNSVGLIFSDSAVEPRMSTNSMDIETSEPPGNRREASSHMLQNRGFNSERSFPYNTFTNTPPAPSNGALQNLQRGSRGSRRNKWRKRLSTPYALVENHSHHVVAGSTILP